MNSKKYTDYQILKTIEKKSDISQRLISKQTGINVASVNFALKRLIQRGYIKVSNMNKKRIMYHLTPSGISQKAQLAYNFFLNNYHLYSDIREIVSLRFEAHSNLEGKKVAIYGLNEITEIVYFCMKKKGVHFAGIYEDNNKLIGTNWYGEPVKDFNQLKSNGEFDYLIDVKNGAADFLNLEILIPEDLIKKKSYPGQTKNYSLNESSKFQLKICGAADTATGSSTLLKAGKKNILVDCGIFQGNKKDSELKNNHFSFNPEDINYLFLTHAHIDHSGRILQLIDQGFKGEILCHHATVDLLPILLEDSSELNGYTPLLRGVLSPDQLLKKVAELCWGFEYNQWNQISKNIRFRFLDAGHIPGSVSIQFDIDGEYIVFSGDIGNHNSAGTTELDSFQRKSARRVEARDGRNHNTSIRRNPVVPDRADILILESTVHNTSGFSAHADHDGLVNWVEMIEQKPHTIYLNHGKSEAQIQLKRRLQDKFNGITIISGQ